jgi:hypothetical protein
LNRGDNIPHQIFSPTVAEQGFFWRDYPPIERVLYENMADYYDVRAGRRQTKLQQAFSRRL